MGFERKVLVLSLVFGLGTLVAACDPGYQGPPPAYQSPATSTPRAGTDYSLSVEPFSSVRSKDGLAGASSDGGPGVTVFFTRVTETGEPPAGWNIEDRVFKVEFAIGKESVTQVRSPIQVHLQSPYAPALMVRLDAGKWTPLESTWHADGTLSGTVATSGIYAVAKMNRGTALSPVGTHAPTPAQAYRSVTVPPLPAAKGTATAPASPGSDISTPEGLMQFYVNRLVGRTISISQILEYRGFVDARTTKPMLYSIVNGATEVVTNAQQDFTGDHFTLVMEPRFSMPTNASEAQAVLNEFMGTRDKVHTFRTEKPDRYISLSSSGGATTAVGIVERDGLISIFAVSGFGLYSQAAVNAAVAH